MRESEVTRVSRWRMPADRRAKLTITAIFGTLALFAAACQSTNTAAPPNQPGKTNVKPAAATNSAQITITPKSGSSHAKTSHGISVTVANGKLETVHVSGGGNTSGTLSPSGTTWHTKWALRPGAHYSVTATAKGTDGKTATATSSFGTFTPAGTDVASTILGNESYGVGMPIFICLSSPVAKAHRAQVERAIQIKSSKPVVGAWIWATPEGTCDGSAQALIFRPRVYWPQHTHVKFDAHLNGLEASRGVYFTSNLSQGFRIGASLIGVTSTLTHHTRIYYKNKLWATWPDSSGTPGSPETETANGAYLTIEKANPTLMSGPGYKNVPVYWSVRFTWSGNYYHDAPWSVGSQGAANVSHGCVNLSPQDSQWYYEHAVPGDPITIIGSPLAGNMNDGYTQWFLTWKQLLHYSGTHMAVQAGPTGSTLVDPSTLPATVSHSITHNSRAGNFLGGDRKA